jgi:hypothetical protein
VLVKTSSDEGDETKSGTVADIKVGDNVRLGTADGTDVAAQQITDTGTGPAAGSRRRCARRAGGDSQGATATGRSRCPNGRTARAVRSRWRTAERPGGTFRAAAVPVVRSRTANRTAVERGPPPVRFTRGW